MLSIDEIRKATGIYSIPRDIHINKSICFDFRLFSALVHPNADGFKDYNYDFDVYLPKYGTNLQRPYVWEHCQQQEFILSIVQEKPIDPIVIIQHNNDSNRENTTNFVIDGKQRLLTIQKFGKNEFPIVLNGQEYYFKDFDPDLKRLFEHRVNYMTATVYYTYDDTPLTDDMRIVLFNYYNFAGTPQTEEHKNKLQSLLK
jgi:hypothetical protein